MNFLVRMNNLHAMKITEQTIIKHKKTDFKNILTTCIDEKFIKYCKYTVEHLISYHIYAFLNIYIKTESRVY